MNEGAGASTRDPTADVREELYDPLSGGFPIGLEGRTLFAIAFVFSLFQLATSAHLWDLPSQIVRAVHVGFLCLLGLPLVAAVKRESLPVRALFWLLGVAGMAVAAYQWWEYKALIFRAGMPVIEDTVVGVVALVVLFVATWRIMGPALPIIAGLFLAYCLFGQYAPGPFVTRGYDFSQVIDHMAFGTEGIYGIPVYVSSTYIFLFILFGSFLERAGMIRLFTDIALGLVGHAKGGAAKVAVISSGLMGTISGSGVANVVTTGQFTIPLMKRFGYRPAFAGGVEATASMGGQIMPPVMGAVAFIMAETLNVAYAEVVKAALIPAVLYFGSVFWMVHLEAGKRNLLGLKKSELPSARAALAKGWYLLLPLVVLVWLLFSGYTPLYAGTIGLALTALLILGAPLAARMPQLAVRFAFWIALGLAAAAFFQYGILPVIGALAVLIAACGLFRGGRETLIITRDALAEGAKTALPVGIACAIVGIIVGTMTLTGVANTFGQLIVSVGASSLFLSLVLTMITCIILGMGIPTIPNYIITSSIAGPALLALGVPLIVSHMFVFYFGILADLTPPVALACFAAAPIAKAPGLKISFEAVKVALAGFVIPFMAVYTPALMLQDGGPLAAEIGYIPAVLYIVLKVCLAIGLWGAAAIGYLLAPLRWWERLLSAAAAFTLVAALPATDEIGFALSAFVIGTHWWRVRRTAAPATAGPGNERPAGAAE
ncbi:TRAP transporter permease [Aurantimonas sp. VKM B-3413]|uniref:TRAP transporter permease n=1 Tax=Aurantimonas sp. VKM B-3413 TaxID=2779401 RepID=UPI001E590945|nr:TRAP transporter permease [Aurantimonas sp. VKM B-3413]MCB8836717.1 TRAP transporter permease [Aurantimonas sp. VKM B-3413]